MKTTEQIHAEARAAEQDAADFLRREGYRADAEEVENGLKNNPISETLDERIAAAIEHSQSLMEKAVGQAIGEVRRKLERRIAKLEKKINGS